MAQKRHQMISWHERGDLRSDLTRFTIKKLQEIANFASLWNVKYQILRLFQLLRLQIVQLLCRESSKFLSKLSELSELSF